ncbi:MAG: trypsin-like peptidase domain-containing protein [Anaerolineales bacterium]|nr:trypsin-like peptidase domain-containing protein [Anaerolineales bacterium]MBX3036503.1 trypsin-like peptidase domain-containing protein [Anaerolineales bacterium]
MKTKRIIFAFLILVLASLACQTPFRQMNQATPPAQVQVVPTIVPANPAVANPSTGQQEGLVDLYENVSRGTVAILTDVGAGSGFVYDSNGHIITNYHVIEGSNTVEVRFTSGFMAYGTVIGTDLDSDIAVVKVDVPSSELFPLPLGDSNLLKVGQTVVAIGNPFGLESTMTVGIISALGRTLDSMRVSPDGAAFSAGDIIQTDAAINPGNSGGPLFNINGEVIGINRAIRTTNFTQEGEPINSGIGFAISINIVKRVAPSLISQGKYDYPFLGIASTDLFSLQMVEALGLNHYTGAYVTNVVSGGPADKAGLKAGTKPTNIPNLLAGGDLIIAIDGVTIRTFDEMLAYLLTNKSPGDTVVLTVLRDNQPVDVTITLDKRP